MFFVLYRHADDAVFDDFPKICERIYIEINLNVNHGVIRGKSF